MTPAQSERAIKELNTLIVIFFCSSSISSTTFAADRKVNCVPNSALAEQKEQFTGHPRELIIEAAGR